MLWYIDIKIIVKMTIPYEEMTATGELEFKRGEKYLIISTNCKIKIEIQIKDRTSPHPATVTVPTISTTTSTTTSTSITSESTTESPSYTSGDIWIAEISKQKDTNDVETRDEARIQEESKDGKIKIFSLEFSLGGFSGIGFTLLMISICYFVRRIFLCVRNRRRLERERMRGDSLATDLSYQTPREIFA